MTRFTVALLATLACVAPAASQEQCSTPCQQGFLEYMARESCENNQWPHPYHCYDRQAVRDPFAIMVQNGWRRQNLVADHHFREMGAQLNDAGQTVIRRIVNEMAAQHHPIYVRRGQTAEETAARMAAVQQFAAKVAVDGNVPPVLETNVSPAGYPAGWPPPLVGNRGSNVGRQFQVSVPKEMYLPDSDKQGGGASK